MKAFPVSLVVAFGTVIVFIGAAEALEAFGIEDAPTYCFGAAIVASLLTIALTS